MYNVLCVFAVYWCICFNKNNKAIAESHFAVIGDVVQPTILNLGDTLRRMWNPFFVPKGNVRYGSIAHTHTHTHTQSYNLKFILICT